MSQLEQALYVILTDDATVSGLIGTRVYPLLIPQDAALPAIAYQRISRLQIQTQSGPSCLSRARMQLTCVATTYSGVKALADAVRVVLDGYKGTAASVSVGASFLETDADAYADESELFSVRMDFRMWHEET